MSLLFTDNTPEKCSACGRTQFTVQPIVQITTDKREQHMVGHLLECVNCNTKRILGKDYFNTGKR